MPSTGLRLTIKAAFKVYSFFFFIYSLVPSIGSINQKVFFSLFIFILKSTVSSETIGILGVMLSIFLVKS